jgi:hypothetical protein
MKRILNDYLIDDISKIIVDYMTQSKKFWSCKYAIQMRRLKLIFYSDCCCLDEFCNIHPCDNMRVIDILDNIKLFEKQRREKVRIDIYFRLLLSR